MSAEDQSDRSESRPSRRERESEDQRPLTLEQVCRRLLDTEDLPEGPVGELVKEFLWEAFSAPGDDTIGDRITNAYARAANARQGRSFDPNYRNAEYFMLSLSAVAERNVAMIGYTAVGSEAYDALKYLAHFLNDHGFTGLERRMRAAPDEPLSRPGGGPAMAHKGLGVGLKVHPDMVFNVEFQRNRGELPRCNDMFAPKPAPRLP
jgi:hypothetical protein